MLHVPSSVPIYSTHLNGKHVHRQCNHHHHGQSASILLTTENSVPLEGLDPRLSAAPLFQPFVARRCDSVSALEK